MWEEIPALTKAFLSGGALGLIGVCITVYSATRKNHSDVELALRKMEGEKEAVIRAREEAVRQRENALYESQIAELKEDLAKAELRAQAADAARQEALQKNARRY